MPAPEIVHQRLSQQRLSQNPFHTPEEVVAWLGAVQAQDYSGAKWALGLRMKAATDQAIEQAFADGAILRTHVMRPTWHFVTPADIRWLLELTAGRVKAMNAYMDRRLELACSHHLRRSALWRLSRNDRFMYDHKVNRIRQAQCVSILIKGPHWRPSTKPRRQLK